jgi:hypothetical protein
MNFAWAGLGDLMAGRPWTPPRDDEHEGEHERDLEYEGEDVGEHAPEPERARVARAG